MRFLIVFSAVVCHVLIIPGGLKIGCVVRCGHRQIHKTLDHLPSLVVEAGLEQVRPFCCRYSTITLVSYVHKYAFPFFSSKLR